MELRGSTAGLGHRLRVDEVNLKVDGEVVNGRN